MRKVVLSAAFLLFALSAFSVPPVEQLAMSLLPTNVLNEAAGFFGPVTKRYMPVFERFGAEYEASPDKMTVIAKYLPQAEAALAEAKNMRVSPRFEAEKAKYIRLFDVVMASARLSVRLSGLKVGGSGAPQGGR
ncbi:MAG: hypothetical protein IJG84_08585 [Kiritimatiellae bacterium]|nr:hypothetical protein [Kiritimatiellia bacterium]